MYLFLYLYLSIYIYLSIYTYKNAAPSGSEFASFAYLRSSPCATMAVKIGRNARRMKAYTYLYQYLYRCIYLYLYLHIYCTESKRVCQFHVASFELLREYMQLRIYIYTYMYTYTYTYIYIHVSLSLSI